MARDLPLGNGRMLVTFDPAYNVRDVFFPSVGQENHISGQLCRTGIWVDGSFSWLSSSEWSKSLKYRPDTLVTEVVLENSEFGLRILFNDAVDFDRNIFLRRATISNLSDRVREVRLYFHYDFHIYGVGIGDTMYYDPVSQAIIAYKGKRYFIISGKSATGDNISEWATGQADQPGKEGTWRDAEDGHLGGNPIAQGSVDATIGLHLVVPPMGEARAYHWLGAGVSLQDVQALDHLVQERGPDSFIIRTEDYWRAWVNKESTDFGPLPQSLVELYKRSLLVMRTHVDNGGGIIASTDWDITSFNRDTYCYVWPRDGALVALAFSQAGYSEIARAFFLFCQGVITREGYFHHKYGPLGDVASSWHPFVDSQGRPQLPIQEDETGLVLYALWKHYMKWRNIEFITPLYRSVIKAGANFMVSHRHRSTSLPAPCYDLWEERWGIHTFTVATVWAGLQAAAFFTRLFNERDLSASYLATAAEIKEAALRYLYDAQLNRFVRGLYVRDDDFFEKDLVPDSSILAVSKFGMFEADDPKVVSTASALRETLWCGTSVGGMARYQGDKYFKLDRSGPGTPGNPWLLCTMWLAQCYIARASNIEELQEATDLLRWAERHALTSGLFSEQIDPYTGEAVSVSPLTWSHAEYALTVQEYMEKYRE
ncbi:MAG: glycoside hydrolase family 15 protein, partial [Dehalococcoidia bacterium]|nr:glycoside hydrolase family 15 protein [Dehalococcoidia bacterium]